jgi:hypothetical protein
MGLVPIDNLYGSITKNAWKPFTKFVTLYHIPLRPRWRDPRSRRAAPTGQAGATRDERHGQVGRPVPPSPSPKTAAPIYRQSAG